MIVGQSWLAGSLVRVAVLTLDEVGAATRALGVDAELVLAPGGALRHHWKWGFSFTFMNSLDLTMLIRNNCSLKLYKLRPIQVSYDYVVF